MSGSRLRSCSAPWSRPSKRFLPSDPPTRLCGKALLPSLHRALLFLSFLFWYSLLTQDGPTSVACRFYFETIMVAMFTIEFIARVTCHSDSLKQLKKFILCKCPQYLLWRGTFAREKKSYQQLSPLRLLQHHLLLSTYCRFCHTTSRWPWQRIPPYTFASLSWDCSDCYASSGLSNTRRQLSWRSRSWLLPSSEAWTLSVLCSSFWSRERCSFRPFCISQSEVKSVPCQLCVFLKKQCAAFSFLIFDTAIYLSTRWMGRS